MSNTNDWTINTDHFDYARSQAKARAAHQWALWMANPESLNLWATYNSVQNTDWFDPWLEKELGGFFNGPSVQGSLAYEVTQNAYYVYTWLKYKGYDDYCITALLTIIWNECNYGMGSWEGELAPWSFNHSLDPQSLINFSPQRTNETATYYDNDWHKNGSIIPSSWCTPVMDEVTHITYRKERLAGSWAAYRLWEIATYTDVETGLERVQLDGDGNPMFYIPDGSNQVANGYGIVQWTNWTQLVNHAGRCFPNYGQYHWQFNATLQLMVLEWERGQAMSTPSDSQWGNYYGEWVNNNATRAYFVHDGVIYHYPAAFTWDQWASGVHLEWVESKCAELGITSETTIDRYKMIMTFHLFGQCYLHSGTAYYNNFDTLSTQRNYFRAAMQYWDSTGGYDVKDIPRLRDYPNTCELDQFHLSQAELVTMILSNKNRRRRKCRIILT